MHIANYLTLITVSSSIFMLFAQDTSSGKADAVLKIFKTQGLRGFYTGSLIRSCGIMAAIPPLDFVHTRMQQFWER